MPARRRMPLPQARPRPRTPSRGGTRGPARGMRGHRRHRLRRGGRTRRRSPQRTGADAGDPPSRAPWRTRGALTHRGRAPGPGGTPMRTLVVRLDNAGDVLLCGPAVRAVAAGSEHVTVVAGPEGADAARLL